MQHKSIDEVRRKESALHHMLTMEADAAKEATKSKSFGRFTYFNQMIQPDHSFIEAFKKICNSVERESLPMCTDRGKGHLLSSTFTLFV